MADSKSTKTEKNDAKDVTVTEYTGTGRPVMPQEGDPKAAAEAASNAAVAAGPVEADEAEPGQPVVDPNPAYNPEDNEANEDGSGENAKSAGRKDDADK